MIGSILKQIGIFALYILVQVLILNNILFFGYINPYLYVLFLITLPSNISRTSLLLIGFVMGLIIDIFSGTPGYNAFASVLVTYAAPLLQKMFGPREDHDIMIIPSFKSYRIGMFIQYALVLVIIHHFSFFIIEYGSLSHIGSILLKTGLSSLFTMLLIIVVETFKSKR
ncbi:MAG TPA: rod shape-determining protein MreD [Paludibacteraceae bacterium]|nr:rod shape-determining protein MreD [Paludibacteraceae bacterium]